MINLTVPALNSEPTSVVGFAYYFFVSHCTRLEKKKKDKLVPNQKSRVLGVTVCSLSPGFM